VVEVVVEGDPNFDFSKVIVTVDGEKEDRSLLARTLTNRSNDTWTEENMPPGKYTVRAAANPSGSALAQIRVGQTTKVTITLRTGAVVAKTFLVHFRFDKAFIEPCMREVLRQVNQHAANNRDEKLVIVGHTDKVGDDPPVPPLYNQSLSERRARSIFAYLTFGREQAGALAEWDQLRRKRTSGSRRSINDTWDVREYQHILQDLGFYPGNVDGKDGTLTKEAVRAYRCHKGLPPGTTVDDEVWNALIRDYLGQDLFAIPVGQFFPNCDGEILKWLGCGEEDPVKNTPAAHRPNRRAELLFVRANSLPCQAPQPDTFDLPAPGAVNNNWCLGPGSASKHCCLVSPHLQPGTNTPRPCPNTPDGPWCREPAEPGTITVQGSIMRERPDGSLEPARNQPFVLITPTGEFLAGEAGSGEPIAARANSSGAFSFADKRVGVYSLEVIGDVLVRLAEQTDAPVKGNAVCKVLRANTDRLDVVIINAPLQREIRLPAVAHLMTALHPLTRELRVCPTIGGPAAPQATSLTDDQVRDAFAGANQIWRQARIRFDLVDIVRESYAFRTECEVDEAEFIILMQRCAYPDAVNVFFFGDLAGTSEAGFGVSPEAGAAEGVAGCAVGDRFQTTILGPPLNVTLNVQQRIQVLAHEFGHFLNLPHAEGAGVGPDRLMLPGTADGSNRKLIKAEVDRARASKAAVDDCVPLSLRVSGATRVGGSLSHQFIVIQNPTGVVTVDAQIPDRLVAPGVGTLVMTGGDPGANDRQRTVNAANTGVTEVIATYTSTGSGAVVTTRVVIRVATFTLRVEGATQVGGPGGNLFVVARDTTPNAVVTVIAEIDPVPFCVPINLVNWTGGAAVSDPLRRTVSRANIARTTVSATVAGQTRSVIVTVIEVALTTNTAPFDTTVAQAQIEGVLNSDRTSFDVGDLFGSQRGSLFRARADIPGVTGNTIQARLTSRRSNGTQIEITNVTLQRASGDRFVSLPILAIPEAISRAGITFKAPQDLDVIRCSAGGRLRLELVGTFSGVGVREAPVRGRVVNIFAQGFTGSGATPAFITGLINRANTVWAQAGIEVKARSINAAVTPPAGLLDLDTLAARDPFPSTLTAEERQLLGISPNGPARSANANDMNIYFIKVLVDPNPANTVNLGAVAYAAESYPAIAEPGQSAIALEGTGLTGPFLAHELGHHLLRNWVGDEHMDTSIPQQDWPKTNVMHSTIFENSDVVDKTQVENILLGTASGSHPVIRFEP
jgi:outer membrane protein OmpA-like peptidoglycan-associated protein